MGLAVDVAGKTPLIVRRLILPLALAAAFQAGQAFAQSAFPAPPSDGSAVACGTGFVPLREELEKRRKLMEEASARHAPPDETCKLLGSYRVAEIKLAKYLETNSAECGISPQLVYQIRSSRKNSEAMQQKVCAAAQQPRSMLGPAGPLGDWDLVR